MLHIITKPMIRYLTVDVLILVYLPKLPICLSENKTHIHEKPLPVLRCCDFEMYFGAEREQWGEEILSTPECYM